jgi:CheY-like chemotaxis protein
MLSAGGCDVFFAADGSEALKMAHAQRLQIIFMDLLLPGWDGVETARQILADSACGAPKIVAHTASALARHREDALAAGCVDFIAKPFSCERIYECLEQHLGVQFERAVAAGEPEAAPLERMSVPDGLCARLLVAAELHSTTALKAGLQELRLLSPEAARLAEEIRHLMHSYDMDGIQRLLAQIAIPAATVATPTADHADIRT